MKKSIRLAMTLLLASALLSQSIAALSYTGLGEVNAIKRDTIGDGLLYSEYETASQKAYIFEYKPGSGVLPLVRYGTTVYGKDRLGSMTKAAWQDGKVVLGAVNGDFYSMQTGVPMGVMIENGTLISTDDSKYALGFTADGKAVIGKPGVKMSITDLSRTFTACEIDQLNKFPTQWGVYLLTDDFASTSLSSVESLEIVIRLDSEIKTSGSVTGIVVDVIDGDCNNSIPEGCAVLTVANTYEDYKNFTGIAAGDKLRITTTCAEGWADVTTAIGGGDLILEGGALPAGTIDEDHEKVANPRTAAGIKADGSVIFFAVDGRQTASKGLTETELSALMRELGCVTALNLDGGGSTSVMVKHSTSTDSVYVNIPSDGSYRSIANGLLFVSKKPTTGVYEKITALPNSPVMLTGSSVSFSAQPLDTAYMPAGTLIAPDKITLDWADGHTYAENAGSFAGGTFTAGSVPGEYRIKVTAPKGLYRYSSDASVFVTDKLDSLTVTPSYTKTKPGSLVKIDLHAVSGGRSIIATPKSFQYTLNGTHVVADQKDYPGAWLICDVGYLDFDGNFQTFGNQEGDVEIAIRYGNIEKKIRISSSDKSDVVADFEDSTALRDFRISSTGSEFYYAPSTVGYQSSGALEIGYSVTSPEVKRVLDMKLRESYLMAASAESIKLWISGDIGGTMSAIVADENGVEHTLTYTVTGESRKQPGWHELTAIIPDALRTAPMTLRSLLVISDSGNANRAFTIDDAIVYYGEVPPPAINTNGHWSTDAILKLYDKGVIQDFDCITVNDTLTLDPDRPLSRAEFAKMISLHQNLGALNYLNGMPLEVNTPADKVPYIRSVIDKGLMSGRGTDENGAILFDANALITREEAFKVIGSLIDQPEGGLIAFADTSSISDWAKSGIRKLLKAGLISGYAEDNTIRPKVPITLAEAASLLAKLN